MDYNSRKEKNVSGRKGIIPFLLFFLVLTYCAKTPDTSARAFRLIDNLGEENILQSPLIQIQTEKETLGTRYPVKSYPSIDFGIGENPYGLKRKLKLGGAEMNVLFAPPESEFSYGVKLTEASCVRFGIGIVWDEHSGMLEKSERKDEKGVNFLVVVEIEGIKKNVFQRYLAVLDIQEESNFSFFWQEVDLPYQADVARLSLRTLGGPQNFSFWINPVLFEKGKPTQNVILISADTLRADHLGCYGYAKNTSPHIDALAAESAMFINAYACSPWTLPSHVSLLTSLHGVHHQVYHEDERMSSSLLTIADVFRKHHYASAGITGGGFVSAIYGFAKGFDSYYDVGGVYRPDSAENTYAAVSEWIDRHQHENFFLFIHTYQPHSPYYCPGPYRSMFLEEGAAFDQIDLMSHLGGKKSIFKTLQEDERRNIIGLYDGEIRYTDEMLVGPLLEKLKSLDLYEQTMIVFLSDHGEEFYDHGGWGHGHSLYDESLKVPLIIKFPWSKQRGIKSENLVSLVDVMPTILQEMDLDFEDLNLDGRSLCPILEGEENQARRFLADVGENVLNSHIPQKVSTNQGRIKLIVNQEFDSEALKFFEYPPPVLNQIELYDLSEDLQERRNLADVKSQLARQLVRWIEDFYSRTEKGKSEKAEIDSTLEDQLKALGYIR